MRLMKTEPKPVFGRYITMNFARDTFVISEKVEMSRSLPWLSDGAFIAHEGCGGVVNFHVIGRERDNVLACRKCLLRVSVPMLIQDAQKLAEHFRGYCPNERASGKVRSGS